MDVAVDVSSSSSSPTRNKKHEAPSVKTSGAQQKTGLSAVLSCCRKCGCQLLIKRRMRRIKQLSSKRAYRHNELIHFQISSCSPTASNLRVLTETKCYILKESAAFISYLSSLSLRSRFQQQCSQNAFCSDYATGFCCHCRQGFYGNGRHCLPEG